MTISTKPAQPATPLPWAWESVPHQDGKRIVAIDTGETVAAVIAKRDDAIYLANCAMDYPRLLAEREELVAALRDVMDSFVGDRGAHNILGCDAGKHADTARALLRTLGADHV